MNARMRRIASDWEQLQKDFGNHPYIKVTPMGPEPPERYHVTYFVNGIYLLPDGSIQTQARHDVEITLHADYPRYKPLCRILTPIWHPNFRDGQICIGDIWGAGESLSDIIINIGDMIQYKSWNSYSPLSADAAKWAIEHKHMFPVGNLNLYQGEEAAAGDVQIDLFDEQGEKIEEEVPELEISPEPENDFEITAEELAGVTFTPTAARMQSAQRPVSAGKKLNFKTVFMKGLLWGLIGGIIGFALQELIGLWLNTDTFLGWMGYPGMEELYANAYAGLYSESQLAVIFSAVSNAMRLEVAFFSALLACGIGLFLGLGEGIYYGSGRQKRGHRRGHFPGAGLCQRLYLPVAVQRTHAKHGKRVCHGLHPGHFLGHHGAGHRVLGRPVKAREKAHALLHAGRPARRLSRRLRVQLYLQYSLGDSQRDG